MAAMAFAIPMSLAASIPTIIVLPAIVAIAMFTILSILWNIFIVIPGIPDEIDRAAACIVSTAIS